MLDGDFFLALHIDVEFRRGSIVAVTRLHLSCRREVADALHVADDSREVVNVGRMAVWTLLEIALIDVSAFITDGVGDVEREVVAALLCGHSEELSVLWLSEVLVEVHVQRRTACEMLDVGCPMKAELVEYGERVVLNAVEIAVVAVARNEVSVGLVPLSVLHTYVLGWYHLAVEHGFLGAICLVVFLNEAEYALNEFLVGVVWRDVDAHKLG